MILPDPRNPVPVTTDITLLELADLNRPILKTADDRGARHLPPSPAWSGASPRRAPPRSGRIRSWGASTPTTTTSARSRRRSTSSKTSRARRIGTKASPTMSCLIIEAHVGTAARWRARSGLPQGDRRRDSRAPRHERSCLLLSQGARRRPEVEEQDFRYPGPKPRSKETAFVMLADAVEATARSLDGADPEPHPRRGHPHSRRPSEGRPA